MEQLLEKITAEMQALREESRVIAEQMRLDSKRSARGSKEAKAHSHGARERAKVLSANKRRQT